MEGSHGAHISSLELQHTILERSENKDAAWKLAEYVNTDEGHAFPLYADPELLQSPLVHADLREIQQSSEYPDLMTRLTDVNIEILNTFGTQAATTGANWDITAVDQIRLTDIGETLSEAYAGQHSRDETPNTIRERINQTLDG